MSLDFARLRERMMTSFERASAAADDDSIGRLLRERSRVLAARVLEEPEREVFGTFVVVRRQQTLLGFPIESMREVRSVRVVRLPHAGGGLRGIFQLRGRVMSLVDLLEVSASHPAVSHGSTVLAAVIEQGGRALGVQLDEVLEPRVVLQEDLDQSHRRRRGGLVREVTRDCVEILDVPAIFDCKEFHMGEAT